MIDITGGLVQAAGIIDEEEARLLMRCGVKYLGFPLRLGYHKEDLTEEYAAQIIKSLPPPFFGVLITYLDTAADIVDFCRYTGASIVQLHGDISREELIKVKELNSGLSVIKSLVVTGSNSEELTMLIKATHPYVDAYITDTFDPDTGAMGATGKTHDWQVSRNLVLTSPRPVILAGGLNPDNVKEAILQVKPAGVDVHTGIENSSGRKDFDLVRKFVEEAAAGFKLIAG